MEEFDRMEGYECEMVLVNDYSRDHTFEAIRRAAAKYPNVIGVNLAKNFGQHAALMAAFHYVSGELVVGMDDDLQNHPSQIRQFLKKKRKGMTLCSEFSGSGNFPRGRTLREQSADFFCGI